MRCVMRPIRRLLAADALRGQYSKSVTGGLALTPAHSGGDHATDDSAFTESHPVSEKPAETGDPVYVLIHFDR